LIPHRSHRKGCIHRNKNPVTFCPPLDAGLPLLIRLQQWPSLDGVALACHPSDPSDGPPVRTDGQTGSLVWQINIYFVSSSTTAGKNKAYLNPITN